MGPFGFVVVASIWEKLLLQRLLDADAAADMLRWENSGFSVDASVRTEFAVRESRGCFQTTGSSCYVRLERALQPRRR
jgi:hypothetical protein